MTVRCHTCTSKELYLRSSTCQASRLASLMSAERSTVGSGRDPTSTGVQQAEELQARLDKLDEEVRQAREAYVNNDNPTKDAKLKEVWEKTLAQRGTMLDSVFAPGMLSGHQSFLCVQPDSQAELLGIVK